VRAGVKERALDGARPKGADKPHSDGRNSGDAYKACNRARVQEGIKNPPPPLGNEPAEADNPRDDTLEEVRDLFTSNALKGDG
jgi:hypothetical protein